MDIKDMLLEAPHKQGGHSERGAELAEALAVEFPIRMGNLFVRAKQLGFDPAELWPWLVKMQPGWFPASVRPAPVETQKET